MCVCRERPDIRNSIDQCKTELDINEMCVCVYIYIPLIVLCECVCVCVCRERPRSTTFSGYTSSPGVRHRGAEVEITREPLATGPQSSGMRQAADLMGSGEFDHLEPLQSSPRSPRSPRYVAHGDEISNSQLSLKIDPPHRSHLSQCRWAGPCAQGQS